MRPATDSDAGKIYGGPDPTPRALEVFRSRGSWGPSTVLLPLASGQSPAGRTPLRRAWSTGSETDRGTQVPAIGGLKYHDLFAAAVSVTPCVCDGGCRAARTNGAPPGRLRTPHPGAIPTAIDPHVFEAGQRSGRHPRRPQPSAPKRWCPGRWSAPLVWVDGCRDGTSTILMVRSAPAGGPKAPRALPLEQSDGARWG